MRFFSLALKIIFICDFFFLVKFIIERNSIELFSLPMSFATYKWQSSTLIPQFSTDKIIPNGKWFFCKLTIWKFAHISYCIIWWERSYLSFSIGPYSSFSSILSLQPFTGILIVPHSRVNDSLVVFTQFWLNSKLDESSCNCPDFY